MHAFSYARAIDVNDAIRQAQQPDAKFIGGGTNLLDLMKGDVERPQHLVDVSRLPLSGIAELSDGTIRIGAMVTNSELAGNAVIRQRYPLLSQALLSGASQQLRNKATTGGNLLQRTRCYYFYDTAFDMCNKRSPGSGCAAKEGINRIHAIFGASDRCIAVNPSDMNVALAALDAVIHVQGPHGERKIAIADFHRLPGDAPDKDTTLVPGELITAVDLPPSPFAANSHYLKVRDRASYAFALVSVAAALEMRNGTVGNARIVMGGVAHKPWRAAEAEQALIGRSLTGETISHAADIAVQGARPYGDNAFKIKLARQSVRRALHTAGKTV
jgi:xanthine dehydrogenase YagS FAD-binding subunit